MKLAGISGWVPVADETVKKLLRENDTVRVKWETWGALYSLKRDNVLDPFLYFDRNGSWWIAPDMPGFNPTNK